MITLTYQGTTLDLSDRLQWTDEMSWSDFEQATEYATNGALLVDWAEKLSGRTIALDGADTEAWLDRTKCLQLSDWKNLPSPRFTLVLRGTPRTVIWDLAKGGFTATPVWKLLDGEFTGEILYRPMFWFLEVKD